jgi:hypothetical protein
MQFMASLALNGLFLAVTLAAGAIVVGQRVIGLCPPAL